MNAVNQKNISKEREALESLGHGTGLGNHINHHLFSIIEKLSDESIHNQTIILAQNERELHVQILHYLILNEQRKIFAKYGYSSLFEYMTKELHYSEGSAYRRIEAARLLKEIPQAEQALKNGEVSLTTMSQLQSFFKANEKREKLNRKIESPDVLDGQLSFFESKVKENQHRLIENDNSINKLENDNVIENGVEKILQRPFTIEEKQHFFQQIQGKSKSETEKILVALSPETIQKEKSRPINETTTEIKFYADQELLQILKRVKEVCAHQLKGDVSYQNIIKLMGELVLKGNDPLQKKSAQAASLAKNRKSEIMEKIKDENQPNSKSPASPAKQEMINGLDRFNAKQLHVKGESGNGSENLDANRNSRYIPADVRRAVWNRDRGCCTYVSPQGHRCHSQFGIQIDHIHEYARGGSSTDIANLRLLCGQHNRLRNGV